jgi:hypothetical protein
MGQRVDQIEAKIEGSREDLRANLEELGDKVKSAFDWRERFRANPGSILALAFGGGFIVAAALGASRGNRAGPSVERRDPVSSEPGKDRKGQVLRAWDDIQSALVGVVAAKVTDTLAEVVPGFKEQLAASDYGARAIERESRPHRSAERGFAAPVGEPS